MTEEWRVELENRQAKAREYDRQRMFWFELSTKIRVALITEYVRTKHSNTIYAKGAIRSYADEMSHAWTPHQLVELVPHWRDIPGVGKKHTAEIRAWLVRHGAISEDRPYGDNPP
jgi:hypothetical protein